LQLFPARWNAQRGEETANALLALTEPPTAIMGGNDLLAVGAMRAIRATGLTIPCEDESGPRQQPLPGSFQLNFSRLLTTS
jgi:hypothetical protein